MRSRRREALQLWRVGTQRALRRDLAAAIRFYDRSLQIFPTAEAFTYRGWIYSFSGRLEEAIAECRFAIATDPHLGNPYNDLGTYLVAQKHLEEAIPWFEKAKVAARYRARHFPFLNLGRLYAKRRQFDLAASEYQQALALRPRNSSAASFLADHPLRPN